MAIAPTTTDLRPDRGQLAAVILVADVADGAVHHLGDVGGGEDGWVEAAEFVGRVWRVHIYPILVDVVSGWSDSWWCRDCSAGRLT